MRNGVSHAWGEYASVTVIAMGTKASPMSNCKDVNSPAYRSMTRMPVMKTAELPSMERVNVCSLNNALTVYFRFPYRMPTGSANPSPMALMRIGMVKIMILS